MANRLEIVAGYDLIKRINKMNDGWLMTSYFLQHPSVSAESLFEIGKSGVNSFLKVATKTQYLFTKTAYRDCLEPGLLNFNASLSDIESDCAGVINIKSYADANMIDNDLTMKTIGAYMEAECIKQKFDTPVPQVYEGPLRVVTSCHDLLDAMMYEMQGIHSHNGGPHGLSFVDLMKLLDNRVRTLQTRLTEKSGFTDDFATIESLYNYVVGELPKVKEMVDLLPVGKTIENGIPRLILWRRWWSF